MAMKVLLVVLGVLLALLITRLAFAELPLDDSDKEMQQLMQQLYEGTRCAGQPTKLCPDALASLRDGGDRLAEYLIRHVENPALASDHPSLLLQLGRTESDTAYRYLSERVRRMGAERAAAGWRDVPEERDYLFAVEALAYTRQPGAVNEVLFLLDPPFDARPRLQWWALFTIEQVQARHGPHPVAQARMRAARARHNNLPSATNPGEQREREMLSREFEQIQGVNE